MAVEEIVLEFIKQFITSGPLMLAVFVWLGHLLIGNSLGRQITGAAKAAMGVLILGAGATFIVTVLDPFQNLVRDGLGISGYMPGSWLLYSIAANLPEIAAIFSGILIGAFLVHLVLARVTPWHYVFLAPNQMFWEVTALAIPLAYFAINPLIAVVVGSLVGGLYYTYSCAVTHYIFKDVTGGEKLTVGHMGASGFFLAGIAGRLFKGTKKAEDVNFPNRIEWMKDVNLTTSLVMFLALAVLVVLVPPDVATTAGVTGNPILWVVINGLTFGAGMIVIITGVKLLIAEVLASFEGIARKLIPNAIPGLDCPVSFPYGEVALMIGFVSSLIVGTATSIFTFSVLGLPFILPPVMEYFFMGGTAGIFANSQGGWKGAVLGGAINGVLFIILPTWSAVFTSLFITQAVTHLDPDACLNTIIMFLILGAIVPK